MAVYGDGRSHDRRVGKLIYWGVEVPLGVGCTCLTEKLLVEKGALLGCYAASSSNYIATFRHCISITSLGVSRWKMGPIGCPETSVRNRHYWLRNIPEERSSFLLRGGSLKSRRSIVQLIYTNSFICITIDTRQTLVNRLHVSTSCRCALIRESTR